MLAAMTDGENDVGLAKSLQSNSDEISLFSPRKVVGRFLCLDIPVGFNHVGQVSHERTGELHNLALQDGGWAMGNKNLITETRHTFQNSRMIERCGGLMCNGT